MSIPSQEKLISELVGSLSLHFRRGEAAYQNFHADGRQFLFAKILRDNNHQIRSLILSKGYLLPFEQQQQAIALVAHLDIWLELWEHLAATKAHKPEDKFSFESCQYPQVAATSLKEYCLALCK
ncbi:hypothetical protein [Chamaesiphon sp. OTE_75_metabat_556]|uniref:hypothetical protein n=1 Tax=Chamaesiphon sp. OTE_75_metabat_556 TaxID=2964692 RepID=UPI00286B274E|nr:hypothetical protein [Chamaesiphon sp. OTE_75_metabat_556]